MSSLIILDDIDELEEYRMLKQLADEFDMPIGEVRRLAIIFTILEIDPIKEHTGGVFVMKKMKVAGARLLNGVPPGDAIGDARMAWGSASEDSAVATLRFREL